MIAIDTNILVRLLTGDDLRQMATAVRLIESSRCFVPLTVSLELEWVLRGVYKIERVKIASLFDRLLLTANLFFESESTVRTALNGYRDGFDFADALHLAASAHCDAMYTFDKRFITSAKNAQPACRAPEEE